MNFDGMYERTARLVGSAGVEKLKNASVLVLGLGGVGGHLAETLVRAGIGRIGLCDFDTVDETNLNRQLLAVRSELGHLKTDAAKRRFLDINSHLETELYPFMLTPDNLDALNLASWDYIADAIDDVPVKLRLIELSAEMGIPVISSTGTGNKLDPFSYRIAPIGKSDTDPLCRSMRRHLREKGIDDTPVLFSKEPPRVASVQKGEPMPSIAYMPAIGGMEIASHIIRSILGE